MTQPYEPEQLTRAEVEALPGAVLLNFGANWCGYCNRARPLIEQALAEAPAGLRHIKVEDGSGRPLGRSYHVKLWPTLVFVQDGQEVARVVRPETAQSVAQGLATLTARPG